jgi:hypothetical protein
LCNKNNKKYSFVQQCVTMEDRIDVRCSKELKTELQKQAKKEKRTLADFLRLKLRELVGLE